MKKKYTIVFLDGKPIKIEEGTVESDDNDISDVPCLGSLNIGSVIPFPDASCDREQAMKILEEAAEVFAEVDKYENTHYDGYNSEDIEYCEDRIVSECCDLITATANLLAGLGKTDIHGAMVACMVNNWNRGRYDMD